MGIRSKVAVLPAAVRGELDRLMVERAFSGYQALAEWLQAQGYRISDDSVQRYGVRLRDQLDAIKLAGHQARAFAAAGKNARATAGDLIAINVQQILQQTLGILLQAAEPCVSSSRSNITAEISAAAFANPGVANAPITESCEEPAPVSAEPNKLDARDLIKLTRITVDLSRTMKDQANHPEQLKDQPKRPEQRKGKARQSRPSMPLAGSFAGEGAGEGSALSRTRNRDSSSPATKTTSKPNSEELSEETYQTIRSALLAPNQFTPLRTMAPPEVETSTEPAEAAADSVETTPEPKQSPSKSIESVPETLNPVEAQSNPLEAQPSPPETQSNPAEPTQPQLTAPDRIYPHQTSIGFPSNPSPSGSGPRSFSRSRHRFPARRRGQHRLSPGQHPMIKPLNLRPHRTRTESAQVRSGHPDISIVPFSIFQLRDPAPQRRH